MNILGRAKRTLYHYAFTEGHNPDPASYAVQTLNDIIHDNTHPDWHHIYTGARSGFRGIFQCFDEFKYKHITELNEHKDDLGDLLLNYCGHNNLFRRNCYELPGLVKTGRKIVAKLLKDEKFKDFCNNIYPFDYDQRGVVHINYGKRNFKVALFMHDDLTSFMNALFVDTSHINEIEEYTRPIKCWLSMFFSKETLRNISDKVREERRNALKLLFDQQFFDYPSTIVKNVIAAMELRGFASSVELSDSSHSRSSSHSRGRIRSRSPIPSRGGARKRTARVPRKQRKQCKSRKQRK